MTDINRKYEERKAGDNAAVLCGIIVALGLATLVWTHQERQDGRLFDAALKRYIVAHQCVVAEMKGRWVAAYRCDVPEKGQYMNAQAVYRAARAEFMPAAGK